MGGDFFIIWFYELLVQKKSSPILKGKNQICLDTHWERGARLPTVPVKMDAGLP